jgi:endonuclease/exonuclease/phosphatase family metal-dependent hydrolase
MKKFFFYLLLLIPGFVTAQSKYKILGVGFYNVENLFNPEDDPNKQDEDFTPKGKYQYTDEVYKQKLHNIATVLQQLGTDVSPDGAAIIGMAEVENDKALNDLVQQPELKSRNYKYIWFYGPDVRGITTALLYNPKYLKVLDAHPLHVPIDTIGLKRPTRDVLFVHGVLAGDTVYIMVNHWPSRGGGEDITRPLRAIAAAVDKRIVDSLLSIDPNKKILIMGDLNDNPTDASVIKVLGAKANKEEVALTDIYNPWIKMFKNGSGTEYFESWNLIDQIMLSGSFLKNANNKWKYYKSVIFNKDFLIQKDMEKGDLPHRSFTINSEWDNGYSDHFPIITYFVEAL